MSDTVTLVAGTLLIVAGALALVPYTLRLAGPRLARSARLAYLMLPALASAGSVLRPTLPAFRRAADRDEALRQELAGLSAGLFPLRMTVSDVTAELHGAIEAIIAEPDASEDGWPIRSAWEAEPPLETVA